MTCKNKTLQSRGEEIANSISHGVGLLAALIGTPFLIVQATSVQQTGFIVGVCIFCASMIFLYLTSTLYHAFPAGKAKRAFRIIEHSAIFILIAGTYTPFTLGILKGAWGWAILGIIWGLALLGVLLKSYFKTRRQSLFTLLYLAMGWLIVIAANPMLENIPAAGLLLLLAGGLSYTAGVGFFVTDSLLKYGHMIWHLFVVTGSTFHFFAIYWYGAA